MRVFVVVLFGAVLATSAWPALSAQDETGKQLADRVKIEKADRKTKVADIRGWLKANPDSPDAIMLEHLVAELYRGQYCEEPIDMNAWRDQLDRTISTYTKGSVTSVFLLEMMVTYAQFIGGDDPDRSAELLMQVIKTPPEEIVVPQGHIWSSMGKEVSVNRLKQGAVWALLNGRTGSVATEKDEVKRNAVLEQAYQELVNDMSATPEGRRCLPLAKWWYEVSTSNNLSKVSKPRLEPIAPSTGPTEIPVKQILRERYGDKGFLPVPEDVPPPAPKPRVPDIQIRPMNSSPPWPTQQPPVDQGSDALLYGIAGGLACVGAVLIWVGMASRGSKRIGSL